MSRNAIPELLFVRMLLMKAHADALQDWSPALIGLLLLFCISHLAITLVSVVQFSRIEEV